MAAFFMCKTPRQSFTHYANRRKGYKPKEIIFVASV